MKKLLYFTAILFTSCISNEIFLYTDPSGCKVYDSKKNALRKGYIVKNADSILSSNKWNLLYSIEKAGLSKRLYGYDSSIVVEFVDSTKILLDQSGYFEKRKVNDTIGLSIMESSNGMIFEKFYISPHLKSGDTSRYKCEILHLDEKLLYVEVADISTKELVVLIFTKH